ncbi:baseplate J/gp47 family protein [Zhenpiania hominis]|uniref:Baseplate J/gp47 family protein n=1 Tax=Zhenpiania hominis TaxID=2763644 RepID=A0A923SS46_9FIRM|nr:baseplate J/gp47 family protein [Zhenpiania hominis]MBC6681372.1 baseplate J/gp47 family protein [Zhenpiania hominis]
MFEDRTFENILDEMLTEMPEGVSTAEGSLIYNACAKQAARLEEAYLVLAGIEANLFVDTADMDHLIRAGNDRGCELKEATYAEFQAQFNCAVPDGSEFNLDEYNYTVYRCVDEIEHIYEVGCDTAGSAPNLVLGDLEPVEFIEEFEWGKLLKCIKEGEDEEDIEEYRTRLLNTFDYKGFAGNREYYMTQIKELSGVNACKLSRVKAPSDRIKVVIAGADFRAPEPSIVDNIQTALDPIVNSGEGDGIAPIGHRVEVFAVEEIEINISTTITYDEGYSYEDLQSYIDAKVDEYLLELRQEWEESEALIVRILQIEARIVEVEGILDVNDTTINGNAANLQITDGSVPVRGELTCS